MMSSKIIQFLTDHKNQIIHVQEMVIADAVILANKGFQLPMVLDLHENRPEIMKTYPHLKKFPGNLLISTKKWKRKEGALVHMADRTIVVTKEAKQELLNRLGIVDPKIVVVPNTVKSTFYSDFSVDQSILDQYKDKFVILYLGDTGLRRGLLSTIEALGIIAKEESIKTNIKLVIVGKNSSDKILQCRVEELGLEESKVGCVNNKIAIKIRVAVITEAIVIAVTLTGIRYRAAIVHWIWHALAVGIRTGINITALSFYSAKIADASNRATKTALVSDWTASCGNGCIDRE